MGKKKKSYPEGHVIVEAFESPLQFLEWASKSPCLWKKERESRTNSSGFTGTRDYDEAYRLAKFGWKDGLKELARQVELADIKRNVPKAPQKKYDVYGQSPAPARAAAGEMFSMVNKGRKIGDRPIIKIRASLCYNGGNSKETAIRWGAAMCSYIKSLEEDGYGVQLIGAFDFNPGWSEDSAPKVSFQMQLKAPEQRISLSTMVFWLAHPSALRRVAFAAIESLDVQEWYSGGYGRAGFFPSEEPDVLNLSFDDRGHSLEESLNNIRKKHKELNENLRKPVSRKKKMGVAPKRKNKRGIGTWF